MRITITGDYAALESENLDVYYGWEEVDENEEWCFVAKFNGEEVRIPFSKLKVADSFDCSRCLLAGIAYLFQKYKLTI